VNECFSSAGSLIQNVQLFYQQYYCFQPIGVVAAFVLLINQILSRLVRISESFCRY